MAIAQMAKVMIVSHRTQASELLEALQHEGICHVLNAQEAMVSKDLPELVTAVEKSRDIQQLLDSLEKSIAFLKNYAKSSKGLGGILVPRTVINEQAYNEVVSSKEIHEIIDRCRECEVTIVKLKTERENLLGTLEQLKPWVLLETPVEEIGRLQHTAALAGLIPAEQFDELKQQLGEIGAAIEAVDRSGDRYACIIICLNQNLTDLQKLMRAVGFEAVDFGDMTGTVADLIRQNSEKLDEAENQLRTEHNKAVSLSKNLLKLKILYDHYENLLNREHTKDAAPSTEQAVIFEGWVKKADYARLEKLVSRFDASSLSMIEPAVGEEVPVEIENPNTVRPFESVTRLYGMPEYLGVDPTALLAPFFVLFFAMCLGDAGYGLIVILSMAFLIKKMRGDKKLLWMLMICAVATIVIGVLTGGWFGDAIQNFVPSLKPIRRKLMWFDPLEKPMIFFVASLVLGYVQINFGIFIAFFHNLYRRKFVAAVCDQLTWLVMLNSIVCLFLSKTGILPVWSGRIFAWMVVVPAISILLFSQREGSLAGRLGMGLYQLFSTVFYIGDVLSYVRLMALGITSAGLAMAVNVVAKVVYDIPVVGIVFAIIVWIGGHLFNTAMSALSAFVHTLRLQYVEFFSKFFFGSGRTFEPLSRKYKYINLSKGE